MGRRPAMMLSFTMMGAAIIGIALIPSYHSIGIAAPILAVLCRLVQGFSLGGEVGPTTAFLLESAPLDKRGLMVAWQGASQGIAATIAGLVGFALAIWLTPEQLDSYGWRVAFLLGAVTLPFGLYLRSALPETLHLEEAGADAAAAAQPRLTVLRQNWKLIVLALMVLASGTISTYVTNYMTTYAEDTLNLSASVAFLTTVINNGVGIVSALWGGWVSDRLGRKPVMVWSTFTYLLTIYPTFLWIVDTRSTLALLLGMGLSSFISAAGFGAFYPGFAESLPKQVRGGAFAVIYAVAICVFGATAQPLVAWLIHATGNPIAPAWYLLIATAIGLIAMMLMKESAPAKTMAARR